MRFIVEVHKPSLASLQAEHFTLFEKSNAKYTI